jgi:glycosyltransferase involved in cell wall biosynthesis
MKKRLNIVHVGFGGRGGAARVVVDIAQNHSANYRSSVILLGYEIDSEYIAELSGKNITCVPIFKKRKVDLAFLSQLKKTIAAMEPDVVLFHTPVAYLWGRLIFLFKADGPVIVSVEHSASAGYGYWSFFLNRILSFKNNKIICVSKAVRDHLARRSFPQNKLYVIENGIPVQPLPERPSVAKKSLALTMVARLAAPKDHTTLLRSFKMICEKGYPASLNIVGDGPRRSDLVRMTGELGLEDNVRFMGNRTDVRSILAETDLFVLSTHKEGLPIALLEAMEAGCPIIATDITSISTIITDGVNGLLVPMNDADALAELIIKLIENPDLAAELSRNARGLIKGRFDIMDTVRRYEALFEDLISAHNN